MNKEEKIELLQDIFFSEKENFLRALCLAYGLEYSIAVYKRINYNKDNDEFSIRFNDMNKTIRIANAPLEQMIEELRANPKQ